MRFSIVIPVYNVEKYIRKCMDSVMNQTFRDYEVIVVDDESPDNSMQIVEEFAERYPGMITMIHQKNARQGGARNHGVRYAKGEYIIFVDSDDYVSYDMLQKVDAKLKLHDCDILAFKFQFVTPDGKPIREEGFGNLLPDTYFPQKDFQVVGLPVGPVCKAYRRSFYLESSFLFPEKVLYEDAMTRLLYAKASDIVLFDACLYFYVQTPTSSMRQKPSAAMLDILKVTDMVLEEFYRHGLYDVFQEPLEISLIGGILYVLDFVNEADPTSPLQHTMIDYILEKFPRYRDNPYLDEDMCREMGMLEKKKFLRYHYQVIAFRNCKTVLKRWKVFNQLNQFRKKLPKK